MGGHRGRGAPGARGRRGVGVRPRGGGGATPRPSRDLACAFVPTTPGPSPLRVEGVVRFTRFE
jgi:hypothetical protein